MDVGKVMKILLDSTNFLTVMPPNIPKKSILSILRGLQSRPKGFSDLSGVGWAGMGSGVGLGWGGLGGVGEFGFGAGHIFTQKKIYQGVTRAWHGVCKARESAPLCEPFFRGLKCGLLQHPRNSLPMAP